MSGYRFSYLIIYVTIAIVITWVLWNKTKFGKNIFAIGGFLEAGRIGSATNNIGFMYELDAIAACVVRGVSFSGGVGEVLENI